MVSFAVRPFIYAYFDPSTCRPTLVENCFFLFCLPRYPSASLVVSLSLFSSCCPIGQAVSLSLSLSFFASPLNNCEPAALLFLPSCCATLDKRLLKQPFMPIPDPFPVLLFLEGNTVCARSLARTHYLSAHDEPAVHHPHTFPLPFPPGRAPRSAFAHPLCLGVHGIYKHHSASVD